MAEGNKRMRGGIKEEGRETGRGDGGGKKPVAGNCARQDAAVSKLIDACRVNICHLVEAVQCQECVCVCVCVCVWTQLEAEETQRRGKHT